MEMDRSLYIRVVALVAIRKGDEVLAGGDSDSNLYSLVGGGVDLMERSEDAAVREFREEFGREIKTKGPPRVLENFYEHDGKKYHQICFIYEAEFVDKSLYDEEKIFRIEEGREDEFLEWVRPMEVDLRPINCLK